MGPSAGAPLSAPGHPREELLVLCGAAPMLLFHCLTSSGTLGVYSLLSDSTDIGKHAAHLSFILGPLTLKFDSF